MSFTNRRQGAQTSSPPAHLRLPSLDPIYTHQHSLPVIVTPTPTSPAPPAVPAPAPALVLLRVRVPGQRADDGAAERADSGAQQDVADYAARARAEEAVSGLV